MQKTLLILSIFVSTHVFGQNTKEAAYLDALGLTIVDSISPKNFSGRIYTSIGYAGFMIQLDTNMVFKKINFTCFGISDIDSGSWSIYNLNTLVLHSKNQTLFYDVIKFDSSYFFILPTERQKFIDDLQQTRVRIKNDKTIKIDNLKHSENYLIWYFLKQNYYTRRI